MTDADRTADLRAFSKWWEPPGYLMGSPEVEARRAWLAALAWERSWQPKVVHVAEEPPGTPSCDPDDEEHQAQPVGEDESRAAGHQPWQRCADQQLCFRVDARRRLVENQHPRI